MTKLIDKIDLISAIIKINFYKYIYAFIYKLFTYLFINK